MTEKGLAECTNHYTEKEEQLQMAYLEKPRYGNYIIWWRSESAQQNCVKIAALSLWAESHWGNLGSGKNLRFRKK